MGEVKRYASPSLAGKVGDDMVTAHPAKLAGLRADVTICLYVADEDYARLERERDEAVSIADSMGRDAVEFSAKLAEAQVELTRLRAVEAELLADVERLRAGRDTLVQVQTKAQPVIDRFFLGLEQRCIDLRALAEACGRKG